MASDVSSKKSSPLIIEPHPDNYTGFPFITLIQYRKQLMLTIIDNITDDTVTAFVLDLCGPENIDEENIISVAAEWHDTHKSCYPISIEFARRDMMSETSKIYRVLNIEFITRIIGPAPKYPINVVKSSKRRRRKPIPAGMVVKINHTDDNDLN